MKNVFEIKHPIIQHKLTQLRSKETRTCDFRKLCDEIGVFLGYEALKDIKMLDKGIETPITFTSGKMIEEENITFVVILRAGLGMLNGILEVIPSAKVGHIGLYRDENTLEIVEYFSKLPNGIENTKVMLLDPMIATGGSIIDSINILKAKGVKDINVLSLISSPEGLNKITTKFDDINIYTAAIDDKLNEKGYIVPGLGDAGDRIFGTH